MDVASYMEDLGAAGDSAALQHQLYFEDGGPGTRDFDIGDVQNTFGLASDSVQSKTFKAPIIKGRKNYMYDTAQMSDAHRVLQNRLSAKKSKEEKKTREAEENARLAHLICENGYLTNLRNKLQQMVYEAEVFDSSI
jgi:hypothetical protein